MEENTFIREKPRDWWKPVFLIILIIVLFIIFNFYGFGKQLEELQHWIRSLGLWGPIAFFLIYLGAVIATIPGTILGVIAGSLFGSFYGVIIISIASTIGASITFLIARYFARDAVARWLSKNKTMKRLDQLTEDHGMIMVGLTRLIPLFPFTLLNYGFGLTKVSFKTYVFWSWLCMLPGTIIVVVSADAITQGLIQGHVSYELIGVIALAAISLGLMVWYARRQYQKKTRKKQMKQQLENPKKTLSTKEVQTILVSQYIDQCIQCHHCMDVCPVTKDSFTIAELNTATKQGTTAPEPIREFTFNCMQCGKCVPVCPMNIRRDYMVRYLKHKLKDQKPRRYISYLRIKGPDKKGFAQISQNIFIGFKKITTRKISPFMETVPLKNADALFYPGCYVYSTKTVKQTLRLLDHIGCSYAVLGGVTTCCGAPHLLQGEYEQADHYRELLQKKIKKVDPKIVLTGCAECYEAINQIKTEYNEKFEVLSIIQYLSRNIKKFPDIKIRGKIMVHDSCRFKKESAHGSAARHAVSVFGELTDENTEPICCYQWNHGNDPENKRRQNTYLSAVQNTAPTLACTCLTCSEELKKTHSSAEVIDIIQLFDEALNTTQSKEKNQQ